MQNKDSFDGTIHDLVNRTAIKQAINDVVMVFHQA
jgi:protein required for attachment to host cells